MPVPILNSAQMRQWECAAWAAGQDPEAVIAQAGAAVAARALSLTRPGDRVLILAGRGHNGDDARRAAARLGEREVDLLTVIEPASQRTAVERSLRCRPALVIDGLFGIGLNRALSADWIALIEDINRAEVRVLAVDLPSGLDPDTGLPLGAAVRADLTLTLGAPKAGLLETAAGEWVGRLEIAAEIGLGPCPVSSSWEWTLPTDFIGLPPRRLASGHKGSYGHVAILAGSSGYHGAAILAARGAQRAQPGLVTLLTPESVYVPVACQLQAVMVQPWSGGVAWAAGKTAIVMGPGLAGPDVATDAMNAVAAIWRNASEPVVVDATALDWLPRGSANTAGMRVITPHPGEAARLLGTSAGAVQTDRAGALLTLSKVFGSCWVVLKGQHTLVGRDTGPILVNSSGNPHLAQGGAGDVLAGYLGGLLAQPVWSGRVEDAIRFAVWRHGEAADRLTASRPGWIIEELMEELGENPFRREIAR